MRTREQILKQLQDRYDQMERISKDPTMEFPCQTCKYFELNKGWMSKDLQIEYAICSQPLVMGFTKKSEKLKMKDQPEIYLCGPERALWEPKLNFFQRILTYLTMP